MINLVKTKSGRKALLCKAHITKDLPTNETCKVLLWFDEIDCEMVLSPAFDIVTETLYNLDDLFLLKD